MLKDEGEKIRKFFNEQYVKMKRMAAVGSLVLLAVNLSFTVYPYIEFRFPEFFFGIIPRTWVIVPLLLFFIIFLIWCVSHIYIRKMEMYRTESRADQLYNPYAVYAFNPFQEMWWRNIYVPQMEGIYYNMSNGNEKDKLKKQIEMVKDWLNKGYIPKKDFPNHLKKYYLTKKEQRL